MKQNLTALIFAFLITGVFAQNEMMHVPNGTSGISATTDSRGVGIGADLSAPDARLHVTDNTSDGTILLIEGQELQLDPFDPTGSGGGVPTFTRPEYLIRADFDPITAPIGQANTQFSVDINGKIQSGLFSSSVNEQLAVKKNLALYNSINQRIKLEVTSQFARLLWKAPGNNFQFVNEDNATVALQLGEFGDVGINTGTFTSAHKLHVEGGALADYSVVQPAANWISGGNYLGMYFSDRPEIKWDSDATSYFEFKAADTGEVPLRLTSSGKVGINTDNFADFHNLFVEGGTKSDYIDIQPVANWQGGDNYLGLHFTNRPEIRWKSDATSYFEFKAADTGEVPLRLSSAGKVGVNTDNFTQFHKFHVIGGTLSDYSVVQAAADWDTGDNYLGMYFSDHPELRWNSGETNYFEFKAADTGEVPLRLSSAGKVGINTDCFSGTHSLFIEGSAIAEEIFVQLKSDWCDYVFEEDYYLRPLAEVEDYIKDNGHLPNIPSAAEIEETGIPLGEMERLLTEKVEELTLYIIQMQKEIDTLKEEINR